MTYIISTYANKTSDSNDAACCGGKGIRAIVPSDTPIDALRGILAERVPAGYTLQDDGNVTVEVID